MTFITSVERIGFERGWAQGFQEGLARWREEGRQQVVREQWLKNLQLCLKLKFGAEGLRLMPELEKQTDLAVLQKVCYAIEPAASPDDLRRLLP